MHVAVVGAGALGAVYGVRLGLRADADVSFVVRSLRSEALRIQRVKRASIETLETPRYALHVPRDADVVVVAVATNQLAAVAPMIAEHDAPVVVLTPMMPADVDAMRRVIDRRMSAAMPSVVGYARGGVVRYWLPPAETRIEEPPSGAAGEAVRSLARTLGAAGLSARCELDVAKTNAASTACFIPMCMAMAVAGDLESFLARRDLVDLASRACVEGLHLGQALGRPDPEFMFAPLIANPFVLPIAVATLRRLSPEGYAYVDAHFGAKLKPQHAQMAREMANLARERGLAHTALTALASALSSPT